MMARPLTWCWWHLFAQIGAYQAEIDACTSLPEVFACMGKWRHQAGLR
jgi:hypothetical protein